MSVCEEVAIISPFVSQVLLERMSPDQHFPFCLICVMSYILHSRFDLRPASFSGFQVTLH